MKKHAMERAIQEVVDDPDKNELQKVMAAFGAATAIFVANSEQEMALARALGDEETAVKEQIKGNVMRLAREIFADSYRRVTGERSEVWDG